MTESFSRERRRVWQNTSLSKSLRSSLSHVRCCVVQTVEKWIRPIKGCSTKSRAKLVSLSREEQKYKRLVPETPWHPCNGMPALAMEGFFQDTQKSLPTLDHDVYRSVVPSDRTTDIVHFSKFRRFFSPCDLKGDEGASDENGKDPLALVGQVRETILMG